MFNGSNWDRKSKLSVILTEPLNSRGVRCKVYKYDFIFFPSYRKENVFIAIVSFVISSFLVLCQSFRINYPNLFK